MPPRKSDVAKATSEETATAAASTTMVPAKVDTHKEKDGINIEDLNLPKSIVTRLAKGVLPPNTQIQGNAMLAMTKSATVFVGYLATHANEYAHAANRKTVAPADVLKALDDLEFGEFRPRLEAELERFNENAAKKRAVAKKSKEKGGMKEDEKAEEVAQEENGAPKAKRARLEESAAGEVDGGGGEEEETIVDDHDGAEDDNDAEEEPDDEVEEDMEEEEQDDEHDGDIEQRDENGRDEDEALDNGDDSD